MKKYKVLKTFRDKTDNKKRYTPKNVYETNEARGKELQSKGFLGEEITAEEPDKEEAQKKPPEKKKAARKTTKSE